MVLTVYLRLLFPLFTGGSYFEKMSSSYKTGAFTTDLLRRQKLVQLNDKYSPSLLELSRCSSQLSEDDSPPEKSSGSPVSPNQTIPSYLPDVWADDLRMNALFTDFRPREVNPAAYDSKLKFWMDVIDRCVRHEELISFTSAQLRDKLQRKGKMPHCFPKVLEDMHRYGGRKEGSRIIRWIQMRNLGRNASSRWTNISHLLKSLGCPGALIWSKSPCGGQQALCLVWMPWTEINLSLWTLVLSR